MSVLTAIKTEIKPFNAQLVAVSKTKPNHLILSMYQEGQRVFGENRVQELIEKEATLPKDISWHMIGHLQSNKVKYIASFIDLIHSVDSHKLLKEINKQGEKNNRIIPCLLEFKIGTEAAKAGWSPQEGIAVLEHIQEQTLPFVQLQGVMGMASFTSNQKQVRQEFKALKNIFDQLKESYFLNDDRFSIISMGMSGDYTIALEEGSTLIRVGSKLFGSR